MKKILYYIFISFFVVSALMGCGKLSGKKTAAQELIPVRVETVSLRDVSKTLEYVGSIKGRDEAIVYPKVSGKVVEKVREEGDAIAKGEPIVYVDRDEVGLKFEKAPVESPLTGEVGRIYVDLGSSVNIQSAIALVTDITKVEINLNIPEKYIPVISLGQKADVYVDAYPKEVFEGVVSMISPVVDLQTRTLQVEITLDNSDHRLQSGMFARVSLVVAEYKSHPAILKEAVIGRMPPQYVYLIKDARAILREVKLGVKRGEYVEVLEGIVDGDKVVIMGQQKLRDGAAVMVEE